ncbi:MAG: hypothetical protein OHK0013_06150 [Sandaracinaceae bacterium]
MARSRSTQAAWTFVLAFASLFVGLAAHAIAPTGALADRVVLYPVTGEADPDALDEVEDALAAAIARVGHTRVPVPGGIRATRPATGAQMEGAATSAGARYVVLPDVALMPGQYRLHLVVGYEGRVEELLVNVLRAEEAARLDDVLRSMLRPAGLGEDALRLSGIETDEERARREAEEAARRAAEEEARRAEEAQRAQEERQRAEEEARRAAEEEAARARAAEEQAQRAEAERRQREQEAWDRRAVLGTDGPWAVMAGVLGGGLAPIGVSGPQPAMGAVRPPSGVVGIGMVQARVAHALSGTGGLELRGGLDILFGGTAGLSLVVGASYRATPLVAPFHVGAVLELGVNFLFTGPQDAGFVGRISAIASYAPVEHLTIEVSLPELGYLSNGPGAVMFGGSARIGYRFF